MSFISSRIAAVMVVAALSELGISTHASAQTGGFVESTGSTQARPRLSAAQIQAFMPARGRFTFPAPYGTAAVRLTNASDCRGGDCVNYVGYSYWRNINNHVGSKTMLIFLGLDRQRGGAGPTLFTYDKTTGETRNAGPLFGASSRFSWATGEGWYFSASRPTTLYMNDGPRMLRYDVISRTFQTVFDLKRHLGGDRIVWQMHSSDDDRVHSATVRHATTYRNLGCAAYRENTRRLTFIAAKGDYDECQIDKSGRWLIVKENVDGLYGEDNRVIDLETGVERIFYDQQGAAGHSDLGHGYLVAEDNFHSMPGAVRLWRLGEDFAAAGQGALVYGMTSWDVGGVGQLAHGNARPGIAATEQVACSSSAHRLNAPRVNEIVCYPLDGSLNVLVVAPNMTDLNATGGGGEYEKRPKGNLDVTGEYFIWTSNAGTGRLDAFIVHVPLTQLGDDSEEDPEPAPAPGDDPPVPGPSIWASLTNVILEGALLRKTSGCDGCPDASAVSTAAMTGSGSAEWTTPERDTLRVIGFSTSATPAAPAELAFAIRLQAGTAEVRERGLYRGEVSFAAGDRLGIRFESGVVRYLKNGTVFHTSASAAVDGVRLHAIFYGLNGAIADVAWAAADSD